MIALQDMYKIKLVGDLTLSPDGQTVAFAVAKMNRKKDEYQSRIYIHNGKLKAFTTGPRDGNPVFTQDNHNMIFYRALKEGGEIRKIQISGGESSIIAKVEKGASNIKIDNQYIYFISPVKEKNSDDVKRITRIPFYFNGEGFIHDIKPQIFRVPIKGGKVEQLTHEEGTIGSFTIHDGKIIYSVAEDEREPFMEDLYIFENGNHHKLTNRKASIGHFEISPDGKTIAVFLKFNERGMAEDLRLYFMPAAGGDYKLACGRAFSFGKSLNSDVRFGGGHSMQWLNNKELLFIATERGTQPIFIYSEGKCWKFLSGDRSIESFIYSSGTLSFIAQYINRPGEVFIKRDKEIKLTNFNRRFSLPAPEHFSVVLSDGAEIDGWVILPEGKGPFPAILEIHGGPKTSYGHAFMFEFYYFLSRGFGVIFTNPRGSSGYGEDFALRIRGEFGKRDYEDLMEAMDYVLQKYPIDKEKIFVTGGSYGGFMTNWVVGHTERFRAAATQRSISNQNSFWGTSDIGPWFNRDYIGAGKDIWEDFEKYWDMSPLKYAKKIKTPLLLIHSEEDYRCPVSEAYQLFYALKMQGIETKLILFPSENHNLSRNGKPRHREIRLKEIADWFSAHM